MDFEDSELDAPLFAVDAEEIAEILALPMPAHPETTFDDAVLRDLIARSYSVRIDEKRHIIASCATYSQYQIDELFRILTAERERFAQLNAEHVTRMIELEAIRAGKLLRFPPRS